MNTCPPLPSQNPTNPVFITQAFKKINKELKKEQIEILKTKYGIDLEANK